MSIYGICETCLRSKIEKWDCGETVIVCKEDNAIHVGKEFCDIRVGTEEIHERAERIREFVRIASDEMLVMAMTR